MADLATLTTRLTEAEAALHQLVQGSQVVEVWRDGRRMKFNAASRGDLSGYIADLKNQIAALEADADNRPRRRPIRLMWPN